MMIAATPQGREAVARLLVNVFDDEWREQEAREYAEAMEIDIAAAKAFISRQYANPKAARRTKCSNPAERWRAAVALQREQPELSYREALKKV